MTCYSKTIIITHNAGRISYMAHTIFLLFLLSFHLLLLKAVSKCPNSFQCGDFSLEFPLTDVKNPSCGLITVDGCDLDQNLNPTVHFGGQMYTMLAKNSTNKFLLRNIQLEAQLNNRSCFSFTNQSILQSPSFSFSFSPNITVFPCESYNKTRLQEHFHGYDSIDCGSYIVYYKLSTNNDPVFGESSVPQGCFLVQLPTKYNQESRDLFNVLTGEFTLEWNVSGECYECYHGGGMCLADNENRFYCSKGKTKVKRILFVGGMTTAALTSTLIILFVLIRGNRAKAEQEHEKEIELFLKNNGNLAPIRYKYSSIKRMTKSFSENLGKGGHGSVYKGVLPNGHLVAVKILNESKGNGEEFMNEVVSISRTSHINVVTLLGFCFERSKRALIYEFMPNGSLDKFIMDGDSASAECGLGWEKLFEIALGIARGLEYLHQGCNTRILHFDIKPHNILLDKDLNPRIADFGLAKLCPNRSSVVSMLVARGTAGYIAPEVFCRNFGEVSYKSDVYSYGMMVLEMAGGRKSIDRGDVDRTSEIYFPHSIYKQLEERVDEGTGYIAGIMNEDESQVPKRKLIIVGLWCIQTNPKDRPSMTKVVEMLEGDLETLQFPPKPYLYSPPRSAPTTSTSESMKLIV